MGIDKNPLAKGCEGCWFLGKSLGNCDYLEIMGTRRPCPGGKNCTEKTSTPPPGYEDLVKWDTAYAKRMYERGASDVEIAKACRAVITEVKSYRKRHWGPANRKAGEDCGGRAVTWDTEKGLQLWLDGATYAAVAEAVGASQTAVAHYAAREWMGLKGQRKRKGGPRSTWDKETGYELYRLGKNDHEIARAVGTHAETVRNYRARNWGPANHQQGPSWDTEKGLELFRQGMSITMIARELGVARNAVDKYAQRHWRGER